MLSQLSKSRSTYGWVFFMFSVALPIAFLSITVSISYCINYYRFDIYISWFFRANSLTFSSYWRSSWVCLALSLPDMFWSQLIEFKNKTSNPTDSSSQWMWYIFPCNHVFFNIPQFSSIIFFVEVLYLYK